MFGLKLTVVLVTLCQWTVHSLRHTIPLGLIINEEDRAQKHIFEEVLRRKCSNDVQFKLWVEYLQSPRTPYLTNGATMRLLEKKVATIVTGASFPETISYSNACQLPIINVGGFSQDLKNETKYGVHIRPDVFPAVIEVMRYYEWKRFTYLHDTDQDVQVFFYVHLLKKGTSAEVNILEKVKDDTNQAVRDLNNLKPQDRKVLLNVRPEIAEQIIRNFYRQSTSYARTMIHFILMQPMEEVFWSQPYSKALKITGFRFYNPESENVLRFLNSIKSVNPSPSKSLLFHDAAMLLCDVFNRMPTRDIQRLIEPKYDTQSKNVEFEEGQNLTILYKKTLLPRSLTGIVHFGNDGYREYYYKIDVVEVINNRSQTSFTWSDKDGLDSISPAYSMPSNLVLANSSDSIFKRTLIVSTLLHEPYVMLREQTTEGEAPQYLGYIIDLLDLLLHRVQPDLKYEIRVVKDGKYGYYIAEKNEWVGMIGEVVHNRADMAAGDITMTTARIEAVEFIPYMSLGIGMLLKKPTGQDIMTDNSPFFFLNGFSETVWVCVVVAYIVVSLSLYFLSRITRSDQTITVFGGLGHSFGAIFFRNCSAHTKSVSVKFLIAIWWIFTFFLAVLYVSSMSSNIMVNLLGIRTIIERQNLLSRTSQSIFKEAVKTGKPEMAVLGMGSTYAFFRKSKLTWYARYGEMLGNRRGLSLNSYAEGIERVKSSNGDFAFLVESSSGKYVVQRNCDLYMPPETFDNKQYGLVVQHDSPLLAPLKLAMLHMQETGELTVLEKKWWTRTCLDDDEDLLRLKNLHHTPLSLTQASGVFYLLLIGIFLALVISGFEMWIRRRQGTFQDVLEENQELAAQEGKDDHHSMIRNTV